MLLESSLLLLNIFSNKILFLIVLSLFCILYNFYMDKEFLSKIKKIDKFLLVYFFYSIISLFFYKTGRILLNFGKFYITYECILISLINFLKLVNLLLISYLITCKFKNRKNKKIFKNSKFGEIEQFYSEIFEKIMESVPFIFEISKSKLKISNVYKKILLKVYRNL